MHQQSSDFHPAETKCFHITQNGALVDVFAETKSNKNPIWRWIITRRGVEVFGEVNILQTHVDEGRRKEEYTEPYGPTAVESHHERKPGSFVQCLTDKFISATTATTELSQAFEQSGHSSLLGGVYPGISKRVYFGSRIPGIKREVSYTVMKPKEVNVLPTERYMGNSVGVKKDDPSGGVSKNDNFDVNSSNPERREMSSSATTSTLLRVKSSTVSLMAKMSGCESTSTNAGYQNVII